MLESGGCLFIRWRVWYVKSLSSDCTHSQLISVISLLSQDVPDLNSPANVDAAKEVREDFASE